MKLPWKLKDEIEEKEKKIERLEKRIDDLEDEKDSWKNRYEAEKDRRSELSRKKQEAEEERNRLREKLKDESEEKEIEETEEEIEFRSLEFREAKNLLERIGSIESSERELVTVYCPEKLEDLSELKSLKNSISRKHYEVIQEMESFIAFIDPVTGVQVLKATPFFREKVSVGNGFETEELLEFIESEKYWATVAAGKTIVYSEEDGSFEEESQVKSRIDREHSKGGFSQGRFERKRDEQIDNHLKESESLLRDYDKIYLLGDKRFCDDLPGEYFGGFDQNQGKPEQFYRFRFTAVF